MAYDLMTARALDTIEGSTLTNPETIVIEVLGAIREPSADMLKYTGIGFDQWRSAIDYLLNPSARGDG